MKKIIEKLNKGDKQTQFRLFLIIGGIALAGLLIADWVHPFINWYSLTH